jgi:hypothetical protein
MIRRVINRLRRPEPSVAPSLFTPDRAPEVSGNAAVSCGESPCRGGTRRSMSTVRFENRRRNRVARASRKANRT